MVHKLTDTPAMVPQYGSPEFFDYPGPVEHAVAARLVSLIVAAECWAQDGDDVEDRARLQAEADRELFVSTMTAALDWVIWPEVAERAKRTAIRGIDRQARRAA
jgi:hypothetical protein